MNTSLLIGAAAGSALMFMLDPTGGRRRRALMRDQVTRATRKTREGLEATRHDVANRARGLAATARGRMSPEPVSDHTLVERVRAKIGRVCSHPHAIDVKAENGEVTLRGPVLSAEESRIVEMAWGVRGVTNVRNELDAHATGENVPSLQGTASVAGRSWGIRSRSWAPTTRTVVGLGLVGSGVWMAMQSARRMKRSEYAYAEM